MTSRVNQQVDAFVLAKLRENPRTSAAQMTDAYSQAAKVRLGPARIEIRRAVERLQRRGKIRYEPGWVVEESVL